MIVTEQSIKASYNLLKKIAFKDIRLPVKVRFKALNMKKFWGLYYWPDQLLVVNKKAKTIDLVLKIVAHEMIHAALEQNAACDHHLHDANFDALAEIVCKEMGWNGGI